MEKKGVYASLRPIPSLKKKVKARGKKREKGSYSYRHGSRHASSVGVWCSALWQDGPKSWGLRPSVCLGQWESISFGSGLCLDLGLNFKSLGMLASSGEGELGLAWF